MSGRAHLAATPSLYSCLEGTYLVKDEAVRHGSGMEDRIKVHAHEVYEILLVLDSRISIGAAHRCQIRGDCELVWVVGCMGMVPATPPDSKCGRDR